MRNDDGTLLIRKRKKLVLTAWVNSIPQNHHKGQMMTQSWIMLNVIKPSGHVYVLFFLLYCKVHLIMGKKKTKMTIINMVY